jgi:hypothetical protein
MIFELRLHLRADLLRRRLRRDHSGACRRAFPLQHVDRQDPLHAAVAVALHRRGRLQWPQRGRNFPNAALRFSAPLNSHQPSCSHCSKRRSSQLVSSVSRRPVSATCSRSGTPTSSAQSRRKRLSAVRSSTVRGARGGPMTLSRPVPARGELASTRRGCRPRRPRDRRPVCDASCRAGDDRTPQRSESRARRASRSRRELTRRRRHDERAGKCPARPSGRSV